MIRFMLILTVACFTATTRASTNDPEVDIETMAASSDIIAMVRVSSITCLRDETGQIFTRVRFDEGEVWKGDIKADDLEVVQAGGTLGRQRTIATTSCSFKPGEWSVLFITLNADGEAIVLGGDHGKLSVHRRDMAVTLPESHKSEGARLTVAELKGRVQSAVR